MPKTITVNLGNNITLLVAHTNPAGDVDVRVDYSIVCDEIGGEVHKSLVINLPPGLLVQQKTIIQNFVIPQIIAEEEL